MMTFQNVEQIGGQWWKKGKEYMNQKKQWKEGKLKNEEFIRLLREAKENLSAARDNFNYAVDENLLEYYIYQIKAAETRLNYFLILAKKEKMVNENYITNLFGDHTMRGSVGI